jgi:peroxiredoxin
VLRRVHRKGTSVTASAISNTPTPMVGERAPDFTLSSTSGEKVSLSQVAGKSNVLLAFFPLAFTSTCTAELCSFSDDFDQFAGKGTVVLPISVDSVPTLKEFKAKYSMKADLLSDFKREVSRKYGVLLEEQFFSRRAYFLINRNGVVRWSHVEAELGHKRDNRELMEKIAALA